jgi:ferritin-like protein
MSTESTVPAAAGEDSDRRRQFLIDLYGVMAYGELSAFERFSSDARFSPTLHDRAAVGRLAVTEFEHFEAVAAQLEQLGVDVESAMAPFQPSIDAFHDRTRPADWYESLMKAYVTDGVLGDFYLHIAGALDDETQKLVARIKENTEQISMIAARLKQVLADDPRLSSRLALWGRRLVGEALTQAQRIGIERAVLSELMRGQDPDRQAQATEELFAQLTKNHSRRMNDLGLTA